MTAQSMAVLALYDQALDRIAKLHYARREPFVHTLTAHIAALRALARNALRNGDQDPLTRSLRRKPRCRERTGARDAS